LAAGLSWFVAVHLFGHRALLFAPVAAILSVDLTPGKRLRRAIELSSAPALESAAALC